MNNRRVELKSAWWSNKKTCRFNAPSVLSAMSIVQQALEYDGYELTDRSYEAAASMFIRHFKATPNCPSGIVLDVDAGDREISRAVTLKIDRKSDYVYDTKVELHTGKVNEI